MNDNKKKVEDTNHVVRSSTSSKKHRRYHHRSGQAPIGPEVVQDRHRRERFLNVIRFMMNKNRE